MIEKMKNIHGDNEAYDRLQDDDKPRGHGMNFIRGIGEHRSHHDGGGNVTPGFEGVSGVQGSTVSHENDNYNPAQTHTQVANVFSAGVAPNATPSRQVDSNSFTGQNQNKPIDDNPGHKDVDPNDPSTTQQAVFGN